ncbi:PilZ domain-containing protein [Thiomicrorhabdus sp. 6S3-12]|uniref:PilZ domain-containing protein n=1 Tax=Thiomicrorhabdus sp. 6S3-12 TaxID=2819681 RepID=UPI001AAD5170|nr:PilZ domain-containing protein [Thiomicrorhabdus sp. 6S3-12]MBO1923907.1 PilZ domain-containing protein [Thiomicrorhabdus sp. 6S3-12]
MGNGRRFFRFDVPIHIYLQRESSEWKQTLQQLKGPQSTALQRKIESLNITVDQLLEELSTRGAPLYPLFSSINHRLNYFFWLLQQLLDQQNPRAHAEYKYRARDDLKYLPPEVKKDSPTSHLVAGLYAELEEELSSLKESIEHSLDEGLFIFPQAEREDFDVHFYVSNLEQLVAQGMTAAVVLDALIRKYNQLNALYNLLKRAYAPISHPEQWPKRMINLSSGGLGFVSANPFKVLEQVNVFMELDRVVMVKGKVLYSRKIRSTEGEQFRTAIEFIMPSSRTQLDIDRFLQHQEVRQAMQKVPVISSWV